MTATLTATATPDPDNPYVDLALAGFAESQANVVRINDAGAETLVRNGDPKLLVAGAASLQDYECPTDTNQRWEARNTSTGAVIATSATLQLASGGNVYLGHPGKPTLNMRVTVRIWDPGVRPSNSAVFNVINKALPVARSFKRSGPRGSLSVKIDSFVDLARLHALLDDGFPLLLRAPGNPDWGIGAKYLAIGDVPTELTVRVPAVQRRWVTLPWVEVDRPAGLAQGGPGFRWADVTATYATWADVRVANAQWADVLDGVP